MEDIKNIDILSDFSSNQSIYFNFDVYASSIAEAILSTQNKTPFTCAIHGKWGTGKTTLLKAVKRKLNSETFLSTLQDKRFCKTVWFNPVKYEREEDLLGGLITEILKPIKQDKLFLDKFHSGFKRQGIGVDAKRGTERILKEFLKFNIHDFLKETSYRAKLGFYDHFNVFFEKLIGVYTHMCPDFQCNAPPNDQKGVMAVFIDDLDRCSDIRIHKLFENLQLFMNQKGLVFILGASEDSVLKALTRKRYSEIHARHFLRKHIQVAFYIPRIRLAAFENYLEKEPMVKKAVLPYLDIILPSVRYNIRSFKRWMNGLQMVYGNHKYQGTGIDFEDILIWNVILLRLPQLKYETCHTQQLLFQRVHQVYGEGPGKREEGRERVFSPIEIMEISLNHYLDNYEIIQLFEKLKINEDQLRQLIYLNETMVESYVPDGHFLKNKKRYDMDLHDYGAMRSIPKGIFLFGAENKEVFVKESYRIGVYPVTNDEYAQFIEAKGYEKKEYWSQEGYQWIKDRRIIHPKYWKRERLNQPDFPVVGVSFFEASAYARWAGKSLPTEQQWERAARGTDGWIYPWGDSFDKDRCNTLQSSNNGPTRVTLYPNGISPSGCYDMAGNVWEWTLDTVYDGSEYIVKGGSFLFDRYRARSIDRYAIQPEKRCDNVGFRCIR